MERLFEDDHTTINFLRKHALNNFMILLPKYELNKQTVVESLLKGQFIEASLTWIGF